MPHAKAVRRIVEHTVGKYKIMQGPPTAPFTCQHPTTSLGFSMEAVPPKPHPRISRLLLAASRWLLFTTIVLTVLLLSAGTFLSYQTRKPGTFGIGLRDLSMVSVCTSPTLCSWSIFSALTNEPFNSTMASSPIPVATGRRHTKFPTLPCDCTSFLTLSPGNVTTAIQISTQSVEVSYWPG